MTARVLPAFALLPAWFPELVPWRLRYEPLPGEPSGDWPDTRWPTDSLTAGDPPLPEPPDGARATWAEVFEVGRVLRYGAWALLTLLLPYRLGLPALSLLLGVFCWPALGLSLPRLLGWAAGAASLAAAAWTGWHGHWVLAGVLAVATLVAGWRRASGPVGIGAAILAGILLAIGGLGWLNEWERSAPSTLAATAEGGVLRTTTALPGQPARSGTEVVLMQHRRAWADLHDTTYHGTLSVAQQQFLKTRALRENLQVQAKGPQDVGLLAAVYQKLDGADADRMPYVYHLFDSLRVARQLDQEAFAQCIVTCVQEIPYATVHAGSCDDYDAQGGPSHDRQSCLADIRFGVQAPSEFMYNLKGDCDTRVLFLYTVLRHFHYDAVVLVSLHYGHSVLGLNLPTGGQSFVRYQGRNYYTWETTTRGYPLGLLAPDYGDMRYWHVVLAGS